MARKKESRSEEEVKQDLTPLIDVVFQLIIFFILTMTISTQDIRAVQLPTALTAVEEDPKEEILMLHIYNKAQDNSNPHAMPPLEGWHITVPNTDKEFRTPQELAGALVEKAAQAEVNAQGHSEMAVLVRGDMRAPSHFFSVILGACVEAKIYKVQVSIKPPPQS